MCVQERRAGAFLALQCVCIVLVRGLPLCACMSTCVQAHVEPLRTWLSAVTWKAENSSCAGVKSILGPGQEASTDTGLTDATTLRAQLSVLQALTPRAHEVMPDSSRTIHLRYTMSHALLQALRDLPAWKCKLDLTKCIWPLPHAESKALFAQHCPSSFTGFEFDYKIDRQLLEMLYGVIKERSERSGVKMPYVYPFPPSHW